MAHSTEHKQNPHPGHEPDVRGGVPDSVQASDLHAEAQTGYGFAIDAVVLAGTHQNPRRLVNGRNKAFLEIGGRALVKHVVDALAAAAHIDQVFVVGPQAELQEVLGTGNADVHVVPQEGKMLVNSWAAIRASEQRFTDLDQASIHNRPLLIISSDLPLISAAAIDDFVSRCAAIDRQAETPGAMLVGVAEEAGLKDFYPQDGQPGIERPLVEVAEGRMRLANIYVARPRKLAHQDFLQTGFSYRKAKDWRNVLKLVISFFKQPGGWQAAWLTVRCQLTLMVRKGEGKFYRWMRAGNTQKRVEKCVSAVLGGSVKVVVTPFGGLSLDVDEEDDYRILSARYEDWIRIHDATDTRN